MSWFLEKAVFSALERVLGRSGLLVDLHREQVRVGAWDGSVRLNDVELQSRQRCRASGVDGSSHAAGVPCFEPFVLESGKIGELVVTIPYMSFWKKRCKLAMKGVRLRIGPMDESDVRCILF